MAFIYIKVSGYESLKQMSVNFITFILSYPSVNDGNNIEWDHKSVRCGHAERQQKLKKSFYHKNVYNMPVKFNLLVTCFYRRK